MHKRYMGEPSRLYDFMNEIQVHCPKCDLSATVNIPLHFQYAIAELKCPHCHFSEKAKSRTRYVVSSKAKCHQCSKALNIKMEGRNEIPEYLSCQCQNCGTVNKIRENWESCILKYNDTGIIDPAFGLPLWYVATVKDEVIWAYNKNHLMEIKEYIASSLRERSTSRFKMTMVEKLPQFIKSAKNRPELLKIISKMEASI